MRWWSAVKQCNVTSCNCQLRLFDIGTGKHMELKICTSASPKEKARFCSHEVKGVAPPRFRQRLGSRDRILPWDSPLVGAVGSNTPQAYSIPSSGTNREWAMCPTKNHPKRVLTFKWQARRRVKATGFMEKSGDPASRCFFFRPGFRSTRARSAHPQCSHRWHSPPRSSER